MSASTVTNLPCPLRALMLQASAIYSHVIGKFLNLYIVLEQLASTVLGELMHTCILQFETDRVPITKLHMLELLIACPH